MSLKAGRSGVKKSQLDPISGEVKVEMPTEIDATTINTVGIRVKPGDVTKIQFKTPAGTWQDFSSGGEMTLLWRNSTQTPGWGATFGEQDITIENPNDYSCYVFDCYKTSESDPLQKEYQAAFLQFNGNKAVISTANVFGEWYDRFPREVTRTATGLHISGVRGSTSWDQRCFIVNIYGIK